MSQLINWQSPLEEFQRLRDEFVRFFGDRSLGGNAQSGAVPSARWGPAVDVEETDNEIIVRAEVPGINPSELDLTVTEQNMTIRGEIKQETQADRGGYQRIERRYGSFARTVPFPVAVKHQEARADYRHGILFVKVPKVEDAKSQATRLQINLEPESGQ